MLSRILLKWPSISRTPLSRTPSYRALSTRQASPSRHYSVRLSRVTVTAGGILATTLWLSQSQPRLFADAEPVDTEGESKGSKPSLSRLIRSYIVYSACSVPQLVDWSPKLLSVCMAIPGVRQITEAVVRVTFFDHVSDSLIGCGCS